MQGKSLDYSIRQCIARREQRREAAARNGLSFPSPYDVYLCRDTEFREYHKLWREYDAKVRQTSRHISTLATSNRAELVSLQAPAGLPSPKDWIGRLVDWACRAVK